MNVETNHCIFSNKHTKKQCNQLATENGYCKKHQRYYNKTENKSTNSSEITTPISVHQNEEIDEDLLEIQDFKKEQETQSVSDVVDINEHYIFNSIDRYFAAHYKRCKYLSCVDKQKNKAKGMFSMETILPILLMSAVPLLGKTFLSGNIKDAENIKPKVDTIEITKPTDAGNKGSYQTNTTTEGTEGKTDKIETTKDAAQKFIKNDGY